MRDGDILVVEDERIVALNLRQQLTKLGTVSRALCPRERRHCG